MWHPTLVHTRSACSEAVKTKVTQCTLEVFMYTTNTIVRQTKRDKTTNGLKSIKMPKKLSQDYSFIITEIIYLILFYKICDSGITF